MQAKVQITENIFENLMLDQLFLEYIPDAEKFLTSDCDEIIRRNAMIREFMENEQLFDGYCSLNSKLDDLLQIVRSQETSMYRVGTSAPLLLELYNEVNSMLSLCARYSDMSKTPIIQELSGALQKVRDECYPKDFKEKWNELVSGVGDMGSLTYRLYFDPDLYVTHFSLIRADKDKYERRSILSRFSSVRKGKNMEFLVNMDTVRAKYLSHSAYAVSSSSFPNTVPDASTIRRNRDLYAKEVRDGGIDMEGLIAQCLPCIFGRYTEKLKASIHLMGSKIILNLKGIKEKLSFLVNAVRLIREIQKLGLPLCFAKVCPLKERRLYAKGAYHPCVAKALASPDKIVPNDIDFAKNGDILEITGANGGGKTTYLRTVGAMQVFFQLGLPVPAQEAEISPVDAILSVFSVKEDTKLLYGKLGQELTALHKAMELMTRDSLFLFNEPICATSEKECCFLSCEIIASLKVMEARGLWVTHFHNIVRLTGDMNAHLPGCNIGWLNVTSDESFIIKAGKGDSSSHGKEMYRKFQSEQA